ncbi:GLPGLI family protein [Robertkochia flava]|uniref:GLPGLI family protein n=1 Tax=Robertkochia flava TaxID=3447986 RepID=UPI001CCA2D59|nr:GLPGLI family protein [Robertkochia marina]
MKSLYYKILFLAVWVLFSFRPSVQEFQGQAVYYSKSKMELGSFGARMSEAQKKQIEARLKNRLEKTYTRNFNKQESLFTEDEKLDAISGATDSWGDNFSRGVQYKNVKDNALVQSQEFYGKRFLVKDKLQEIKWVMGKETKQIGQYTCFKANAIVPTRELSWYDFSWSDLPSADQGAEGSGEPEIKMTNIEAWYTPQIPVSHGPGEYWGLPGLILEVSAGNTTMLCSKVILNPKEVLEIQAPKRGQEITKEEYQNTVQKKMMEMRDNRGRRRG